MHVSAEKDSGTKIAERKNSEKKEKLIEGMKKGGIDQETAKRIMETWEKTGATSPNALRKMLLGRSLTSVAVVALQLLLDGGAAFGAYNTARFFGVSDPFIGKIVIEYGAYFLASYFAIGVVADLFTIGVLLTSAIQYSTNTEAFMDAVKEIAGPKKALSNLSLVQKAQTAVNSLKVAQALNDISDLLKGQASQNASSTLYNLSAYLTLSNARDKYGFDPAQYNLSDREAGEIATIFARYDLNDDMRLEESELRRLVSQGDVNLDDSEVKAALKLLDKRKSGYIEFDEFVDWWVNKVSPENKEIRV